VVSFLVSRAYIHIVISYSLREATKKSYFINGHPPPLIALPPPPLMTLPKFFATSLREAKKGYYRTDPFNILLYQL